MSTTVGQMPHHLVGLTEIAKLFGVSRQYVDRLSRNDPNFPEPEVVLAGGRGVRVWSREKIEKWARASGREIVGE